MKKFDFSFLRCKEFWELLLFWTVDYLLRKVACLDDKNLFSLSLIIKRFNSNSIINHSPLQKRPWLLNYRNTPQLKYTNKKQSLEHFHYDTISPLPHFSNVTTDVFPFQWRKFLLTQQSETSHLRWTHQISNLQYAAL